jgi:hypothetical protein
MSAGCQRKPKLALPLRSANGAWPVSETNAKRWAAGVSHSGSASTQGAASVQAALAQRDARSALTTISDFSAAGRKRRNASRGSTPC